MNRTSKEATVQRDHYQTTDELTEHLQAFLLAYDHAKRLKTLRGLPPRKFVCAQWQMNPTIFTQDPTHPWDYTPSDYPDRTTVFMINEATLDFSLEEIWLLLPST